MIHCYLARIVLSEAADHQQLVVLRERKGDRRLPIVVGFFEAASIDRHVKGFKPPRPFTHDLLSSVIGSIGGRLDRVVISSLQGGTFYAQLKIDIGDETHTVDARPSDAMALAVRLDADIYVAPEVMEEAAG